MTAYVVNEIEVTDPELFQTYAVQALPIILAYGGRIVVRGGSPAVIEGANPGRVVINEFADRATALAWRNSPEYKAILPIRDASSTSRVYVVDGYEG
jgi:uncharacterized protein (DUF1330 family)